jgi:predicted alpha/beta-hydrolase family hydrolase
MVRVFKEGSVSGFLHEPEGPPSRTGLVMTHGAGGNAKTAILVTIADAFSAAGWRVLRCDMAFRQRKASGSPHPSGAAQDRESLRDAVEAMRRLGAETVVLGGHSYGGRQSTMLASEQPGLVAGLLLGSYPLHPPGKPDQLRTAHFPELRTPALFVHGTRDPFGSLEEMTGALKLIPGRHELSIVQGAGHDLKQGKFDIDALIVQKLRALVPAQAEHHS